VISIDNFAVSSVPAPGALALLGVAGVIGGRRRRA
jgi:MYXO-CTERM domain-containing protein